MKKYFEYKDVTINASKFWEISLKGKVVTVNYGRIGNKSQEVIYDKFSTKEEAKKFVEKKIGEKVRKGYLEA